MNNVKVSIKGMQTQDNDTNDVELFTEGQFEKDGDKYILIYKERRWKPPWQKARNWAR